ncbi:outer membrane protein [Acetobacter orientalis]|uniref:Outer membrane protein n=1 Tax=Acetobacter orientalis TaxID=146474 RepID=A0A2Z5ZLR9_9PROT|nr:outer membrane protein [Acetobacter orientalis]
MPPASIYKSETALCGAISAPAEKTILPPHLPLPPPPLSRFGKSAGLLREHCQPKKLARKPLQPHSLLLQQRE